MIVELKNVSEPQATVLSAFKQLQTYKEEIPAFVSFAEVFVISDGTDARVGSLTAGMERFAPWRTIDGEDVASPSVPQLEVVIRGMFEKKRFLEYLRHFIVFEEDRSGSVIKKIAGYHQFHAVRSAIEATVAASRPKGDRRAGVVWHTQGSGKSLTMAFYAGRVIAHPKMENPTLVVLTDRNDLDDQLFGTFSRCKELLNQTPIQVASRADLREKLKVASGGVLFTTIQSPEALSSTTSASQIACAKRSRTTRTPEERARQRSTWNRLLA